MPESDKNAKPAEPDKGAKPAEPAKPVRPIIIYKKRRGHGAAHHGGAWKVAYADFVTAMMALFMVLWLLNSNVKIQEAVAGYFKDPKGYTNRKSSDLQGSGENFTVSKEDMPRLKDEIEKALRQMASFDKLKDQIEMTVTAEGLRIELMENNKGTFFDSANDVPTANGAELLSLLATQIGKLPNKVSIEGHTDSTPFARKWDYTNWELSIDRANAARRLMQTDGLSPTQVAQVRGFADQNLRKADKPRDASNRRVSVIVQYLDKKPEPDPPTPGEHPAGGVPSEAAKRGVAVPEMEPAHKPAPHK